MKTWLVALVLAVFAAIGVANEVDDGRKLTQQAVEAYKAKNYAEFLQKVDAACALRPGHPGLLGYRADALALNGRNDEALDVLRRVVSMGVALDIGADDDLQSLHSQPAWAPLVEAFRRNGERVGDATAAAVIQEKGLIAEGVAFDPSSRRLFVSSVAKKRIYTMPVARDGKVGKPAVFASGLRWGILGMAVDPVRHVLWATSGAMAQVDGVSAADFGRATILEIDLQSGTVRNEFTPSKGDRHEFGDLLVGRDGNVYVSDSSAPVIFRLKDGKLEPWLSSPKFSSLQGLAMSQDGRVLYAADYSRGIFAIDVRTRDLALLHVPDDVVVLGIDGLYSLGPSTLIATQNGVTPQRVIRIALDGLNIGSVAVVTAGDPRFDEITLGVITPYGFYFNGVSQWELYGADGRVKDPSRLRDAILFRTDPGLR